jgi:hypothetical protein
LYWDGGDRGGGGVKDIIEADLQDDLMLDDEEYNECSLGDDGNCYHRKQLHFNLKLDLMNG